MSKATKKAAAKKPGWERVLEHVEARLTATEMKKLSIGEALRLAKIMKTLRGGMESDAGGRGRKPPEEEAEEKEERAQAALRVLGERQESESDDAGEQ